MHRFQKQNHRNSKDDIEQTINEVSAEVGVDLNTQSMNEDPKELAKKVKKAIQKRT